MTKKEILLALFVWLFLLWSCVSTPRTPTYHVNVDSISSEDCIGKTTYILLPGNKDTSISDLQFREFAGYITKALSVQGFRQGDSFEEADIAIFLAYGIGDPQEHQFTYALPVWGQTGVSSSSTFGTLSTYGSYGTYQGTTNYIPSYGITGYTSHIGTYTTYFRYILVDAYDLDAHRNSNGMIQLWKTQITSTGSSGDLRRVFPVLVAAAKPYLGTNTGQIVKVILRENDVEVLEIKGINQ